MIKPPYTIIIIILIIFSCLFSLDTKPAFSIEEYVAGKAVYVYKKTSEPRSDFSFSMKKESRGGKTFYEFTENGKGNYGKHRDITWESIAEIEDRVGFPHIINSSRTIKDKKGTTIIKHQKHFDYAKRKIYYTALDGEGNTVKKKTFPIKGETTDNITAAYFLETVVANLNDKDYKSFYLLSNEPRLYRINIKVIGYEVLDLPKGKIKCIKLRLIPDLGILSGLAGVFIPPTFFWHEEESPHHWVKYDGLETGLGSSHIVSFVISK